MKIPAVERAKTAATGGTATTTERVEAAVEVKLTDHVKLAVSTHRMESTFENEMSRVSPEAFSVAYGMRDLTIAEHEADVTTQGWARVDWPPGTWRKNPEGEQTQPYACALVNGVFSENLDGFDMRLEDGDRVALMKLFLYCVWAVILVKGPSDVAVGCPDVRSPQD